MRYIWESADAWELDDYQAYLNSEAERFPDGARAYSTAPWRFAIRDHLCPHDSWLESILITEVAEGERQEKRSLNIKIGLLGAFHDLHFEIEYLNVKSYAFRKGKSSRPVAHGDWIIE